MFFEQNAYFRLGGFRQSTTSSPIRTVEEEIHTIRCICKVSHDNGRTILCEACGTRQHIDCYYGNNKKQTVVHRCVGCIDIRQMAKETMSPSTAVVLAQAADKTLESSLLSADLARDDGQTTTTTRSGYYDQDLGQESRSLTKSPMPHGYACKFCREVFNSHSNLL